MRCSNRIPLFPLWIRVWHWINASLFIALAITGLSLHLAGTGMSPISFRPAVIIHNACGAVLAANFALYVLNLLRTGQWRHYAVRPRGLVGRLIAQMRYYAGGIFRGEPHPFHASAAARFNPLQQLTYLAAMFAGFPLLVVTGLFMLFPAAAPERVAGMGGVWPMATAHTILAYCFVAFLVTHVYLALTAAEPDAGIQAMFTGGSVSGHEGTQQPDHSPTQGKTDEIVQTQV